MGTPETTDSDKPRHSARDLWFLARRLYENWNRLDDAPCGRTTWGSLTPEERRLFFYLVEDLAMFDAWKSDLTASVQYPTTTV